MLNPFEIKRIFWKNKNYDLLKNIGVLCIFEKENLQKKKEENCSMEGLEEIKVQKEFMFFLCDVYSSLCVCEERYFCYRLYSVGCISSCEFIVYAFSRSGAEFVWRVRGCRAIEGVRIVRA